MKTNLQIIKNRNIWFAISGVLVVLSLISLAMFRLNFGIDFTGGSLMELSFQNKVPAVAEINKVVQGAGYNDVVTQNVGANGIIIRLPTLDETKHQALLTTLKAKVGTFNEIRFESVGPAVGAELSRMAIFSLLAVLLGIAAYIAYAFRKVSQPVASWKYGLITLIAAVFHDVLLPLGIFAILSHFFEVEINSGFVAAILTVLGFSVHDTIVVFDRVRENLTKRSGNFEDVVNASVNETMARSINTTLTTLFPLIAIFVFGGESLKYFSLVLLIGLTAGTYSSVFLAAPLLVVFDRRKKK